MLKDFYNNQWIPAQRTNTQTLLQFNALFDRLTSKLRRIFEEYELREMKDFMAAYGS